MSSKSKQRQPKIPEGSYLGEEMVNPSETQGVPSFDTARNVRQPNEEKLMEKVVERGNMTKALQRVEQNKGAAGIDGIKVEELREYVRKEWPLLKKELLAGNYRPSPVRRVEIPKPDGGTRQLGIPTVIDRLIQQGLLQVLNPIFDPEFSEYSYGFRTGRSAHQAVEQARQYIEAGNKQVVDIDLEKFFDRVNHDILMSRVARKVNDKRVLKLIRAYLNAGVMLNGVCVRVEEGTPQGGPLSPLLANILLDDLDKELEQREHKFTRYADDCNIYVQSPRAGERVMESVTKFLEKKLKLKVNKAKSAVDRPWKRKFLGFSFTWEEKTRIRIAPRSLKRFKERIRELTCRSRSISMEQRIQELNRYTRGWIGYYRLADTLSIIETLDEWIRRRLRMCHLKQWKKPRTKRRNLVKLGIPAEWAVLISGSRKSYWRLSKTPQVNKALGFAYWQNQGLLSLSKMYQNLRSAF